MAHGCLDRKKGQEREQGSDGKVANKALAIMELKPEKMRKAYLAEFESAKAYDLRYDYLEKYDAKTTAIEGEIASLIEQRDENQDSLDQAKRSAFGFYDNPRQEKLIQKLNKGIDKERAEIDELEKKGAWKGMTKDKRNAIHQIEDKLGST